MLSMKKIQNLKSNRHFLRLALFAGVFAVIGIVGLLLTSAATPTAHFELERASLSVGAIAGNDDTASGGSFITFQTGTCSTGYSGVPPNCVATTPPPTTTNSCQATLSSYDSTVISDKPVAYYRLAGENVRNCVTDSYHGSYQNSPSISNMPNGDSVSVFNGVNQYAEIPDNDAFSVPTTGSITIEAWLRPDTLQFPNSEAGDYVHWMGKGVSGQHEYVSRIYSLSSADRPNRISGYSFNLSGGLGAGSYFQDSTTVGQWIHYAMVINTSGSGQYPGYVKIYKNGVLRDQDTLAGYSIIPGNGTAPFRIATRDFNSYFQGAIGKVAVYNSELSAQRLLAHYNAM